MVLPKLYGSSRLLLGEGPIIVCPWLCGVRPRQRMTEATHSAQSCVEVEREVGDVNCD